MMQVMPYCERIMFMPADAEALQPYDYRNMRTLVYKRTHKGDPRKEGWFGVEDCMGRVRAWDFDAVVGVGGIGRWAKSGGISGKVNWIGISPRRRPFSDMRGPIVGFKHFVLFEEKGPRFRDIAPALARRLYRRKSPRFLFKNLNAAEETEVGRILRMARNAPASSKRSGRFLDCRRIRCGSGGCPSR